MGRKDIIYSYYNEKLSSDYNDYRALGWESQEAQYKRFDVLLDKFQLQHKKLLDVGCGIGSLYRYLLEKDINIKYTGVDVMEGMVKKAKLLSPKADFFCTDIFESNKFVTDEFHMVFASGIFNLDLGNNHVFIHKAAKLFNKISSMGFVINLLHPFSPDREHGYFYIHPEEACDIITKACDGEVEQEVVQGYLPNDYSIISKKV